MDGNKAEGNVIMPTPGPCGSCGEVAYIVRKTGERVCAKCYREGRAKPAEASAD